MDTNAKKILIIDDDEMILQSLASVFTKDGFEVITANDGDKGLEEALNKEPDAIITDIEMKNVSGMVVLGEVRKSGEWGKNVPIVLLTNFDADDKIMKGIVEDQPSFYLLKSKVDPNKVLVKIKELFTQNKS